MAMQKFKMFVVVGTGSYNRGEVSLQGFEPSVSTISDASFGKRVISTSEIEVDVPEFDLLGMEIDSLEQAVQKERADSQVRVNILLDRLSKLKAIGHDAPVNS